MSSKDWQDAGLYDPAAPGADERLELLAFLEDAGCSLQEMIAANERGRLFALAGDRAIRGGQPIHSLEELAALLGEPSDLVESVWRAIGLEEPRSKERPIATEGDVRAVRAAFVYVQILGAEPAVSLLRTYGNAMGRLTDAESAAFRAVADVSVRRSGSELSTAKMWLDLSGLIAEIGHLLDVAHRHHIDASRRHFEAAGTETDLSDSDREVRLAVGFIDLSGFTALSQVLEPNELSRLLARFEGTTYDLAAANDCRVVKFIGDAAMIVSANAEPLALAAAHIVRSFTEPVAARAGLSFGDLVAREGDYFGSAANLAARLIAAAGPGTVLASAELAGRLPELWRCRTLEPRSFRGFDEPVPLFEISPPNGHE